MVIRGLQREDIQKSIHLQPERFFSRMLDDKKVI